MTSRLRPLLVLCLTLLAVLVFVVPVQAHNTSVTRIDIKVEKDSLKITLNLNQSDLLEHVLNRPHDQGRFTDKTELDDAAPKVLSYVIEHMPVTADGKALSTPTTVDWPVQHLEMTRVDSNGMTAPATIPMTLRYSLPAGAHRIEVNPQMFTGSNFAAFFDVSVYQGGAKPSVTVVDKRQAVVIEIPAAGTEKTGVTESDQAPESAGFVSTFTRYVGLGFNHILGFHDDVLWGCHIIVFDGLDHILFVLGLYFLSPKIKPLLWQVTAFTVAHSITLALSAYGIFSLSGRVVEPLIALSITAVAVENLFSKQVHWWRWMLVFFFGLVHGMGFAEVFHETRLPSGQAINALLSFNLGVEAGQLTILLGAALITGWWRKRTWYFKYIAAPASILIACTGAFWTVQRIVQG
jgi:hypothetical protein